MTHRMRSQSGRVWEVGQSSDGHPVTLEQAREIAWDLGFELLASDETTTCTPDSPAGSLQVVPAPAAGSAPPAPHGGTAAGANSPDCSWCGGYGFIYAPCATCGRWATPTVTSAQAVL